MNGKLEDKVEAIGEEKGATKFQTTIYLVINTPQEGGKSGENHDSKK